LQSTRILVPTGTYITKNIKYSESYTAFLINDIKLNKFKITNEILYNYLKYKTKKLSDVIIMGTSIVYDDSQDSGWSLYTNLGLSIYMNDNKDSKETIYKAVLKDKAAYGDYIKAQNPDSFLFDNKTYYGGASLLGFRKDFDFMRNEFFINAEWFHVYNHWSSGNQGNLYTPKNNEALNVRDDSYYLNGGYVVNDSSLIRATYTIMDISERGKIGTPAVAIPVEDFLSPSIKKITMFRIIFTHRF